ncbi:hypothetical protein JW921_03660 [Candidatus Fermentibacterales bacterium]|nr:hypothetical protein [Candidatus Fermentibacterales bacterium]
MKDSVDVRGVASLLLAVLVMSAGCGGGSQPGRPEDAVSGLFEAFCNGDGQRAVSYLSQNVIEEIAEGLDELRANPAMAAQLRSYGIEIEDNELATISPGEFAARIMSSDAVAGVMSAAEVTIGEALVDGDQATVDVTVRFGGDESVQEVPLVLEGGSWKIDGEFGFSF